MDFNGKVRGAICLSLREQQLASLQKEEGIILRHRKIGHIMEFVYPIIRESV